MRRRSAVSRSRPGPQLGHVGAAEAQLRREHLVGVLAEPRDPRLGPFGHRGHLHRVARDEDRLAIPSARGTSTSMSRAATCGSAMTSAG